MVVTQAELSFVIGESIFLKPFGMVVDSCGDGECTLRLPFAASLERPGGVVNGMVIMGLADVAMWLAIMTRRGTAEHWVTVDMKTTFLAGARRADVVCLAKLLSLSSRRAYGTAECRTTDGTLAAHHVLTYAMAGERGTTG